MDLLQNPFHLLTATTRDHRRRIMELAEERSLFLDSNKCTRAGSDLTRPRKRLSAELAWLPGTGLKRASEVLTYLESSAGKLIGMDKLTQFKNILGADKMIPIAQANLLAAGLSRLPDYSSDYVVGWIISEWIVEIAYVFENIDPGSSSHRYQRGTYCIWFSSSNSVGDRDGNSGTAALLSTDYYTGLE